MYDERLQQNLPRVEERIARALARSGRSDGVRLIAVTKSHPAAAVTAAFRAGIRDVGENRVQELEEKRAELGDGPGVWHLIGHLQRNKAKRAITLSDLIHSVDSHRLAQELSKEAVKAGVSIRVLVQVNVSGEASKGGFDAARAVSEISAVAELPGVVCEGLMTMAPLTDDEGAVRATFVGTRELLERCMAEGVPLQGRELSMGMSGDFEIAIEEGSTMIRLGTILFGEREP
ncbi:MAG TPA: YggS family pyridoxal phosphate-dependent enzyme [Longimicrobiales bacterium]|nr:YggS family pyridoxal phosphate-dependent enzyme [Longimicrobiales bacterium]